MDRKATVSAHAPTVSHLVGSVRRYDQSGRLVVTPVAVVAMPRSCLSLAFIPLVRQSILNSTVGVSIDSVRAKAIRKRASECPPRCNESLAVRRGVAFSIESVEQALGIALGGHQNHPDECKAGDHAVFFHLLKPRLKLFEGDCCAFGISVECQIRLWRYNHQCNRK